MQCACIIADDGKSFTDLCDQHYALKVSAMARERGYVRHMIDAERSTVEQDAESDRDWGIVQGLADAVSSIDDMDESEWGLDDHSLDVPRNR